MAAQMTTVPTVAGATPSESGAVQVEVPERTVSVGGSHVAYLPAIGALRGIAAVYVVLFHMTYVPQVRPQVAEVLQPFITAGYSGVPLFFIISAFTLCHTMQGRSETHPTLRFYARRAARILPLFYFVLLVYLVRRVFLSQQTPLTAVLANIVMLFNFPGQGIVTAGWSVAVEMQFYVMFPLLFAWMTSMRRAVAFFLATLALTALFSAVVDVLPFSELARDNLFKFSLIRSLPCFAVGMIAYRAYVSLRSQGGSRKWAYWLVGGGLLAFLAQGELYLNNSRPAFAVHALVYGPLVVGLLFTNLRILVNRVTEWLGDISYSLYLWHSLVVVYASPFYPRVYQHLPPTLAWLACLGLTLALLVPLSYLSFRLIEEPARRAGLRLLRRWA